MQIIQGLKSLHDLNIMHQELKNVNVFLYELVVGFGDMNVSRMDDKQCLNYANPETWIEKLYYFKSDI